MLIDEYLYNRFMFALALDYNMLTPEQYELLDNPEVDFDQLLKEGTIVLPFVGMITNMYRRYDPPKDDKQYGNTVVTKFAPSEGKEV